MQDPRYPVGEFQPVVGPVTNALRLRWIAELAAAPEEMRAAVAGLSEQQLDTPYRPDGWTVRQVAHHVPDSHMHSYIRFRWALTENAPTIKPYDEVLWAQLPDARSAPVEASLLLLDGLHRRWTALLRELTPADWDRTFFHPERGIVSLESNLAMYAWHGRHHVAHITSLRERMGW